MLYGAAVLVVCVIGWFVLMFVFLGAFLPGESSVEVEDSSKAAPKLRASHMGLAAAFSFFMYKLCAQKKQSVVVKEAANEEIVEVDTLLNTLE